MKHKQHWLSQQYKQKHLLRQLCGTAVQQQINQGDIPATQQRNRRRFLAKNIIKRMPCTRLMSPNQFLHTASLVLAMWGLGAVIAPSQALAEPVFKHEFLNGVDVGDDAKPVLVDIDNDGDLDAFVGEYYGKVKFYRNIGSASTPVFNAETGEANPLNDVNVGYGAAPALVDIDNDGDLDAFVGESEGQVIFYLNTGTASTPVFSSVYRSNNPLGSVNASDDAMPSFVDIDNDGDLDAFVGGFDSVYFYRNTGTADAPVFSAQTGIDNPLNGINVGYSPAPSFVDIDNDGDQDAFVGDWIGAMKFYRNTGTANAPVFSAEEGSTNLLNGFNIENSSFVDIDNDGDQDAFVGENFGTIKFYRNTGTANTPVFSGETTPSNPLNAADVGQDAKPSFVDIDNDGDLDVFVRIRLGTVKFYRNTGTANVPVFSTEVGDTNPLNGVNVTGLSGLNFVDIDNDGDMDVFTSSSMKFYRNTGSASAAVFSAETGETNPLNDVYVRDTFALSFIDIDNDDDQDLFLGNRSGTVKFFRNTGTASAPVFSKEAGEANPMNGIDVGDWAAPVFADIDHDGDYDVFVWEYNGSAKFYRNTGTASAPVFSAETGANTPLNGFGIGDGVPFPSLVDINNDGDLDVFVGLKRGKINFFENFEVQTLSLPEDAGDLRVQVNTAGASIPSSSLAVAPLVNPPAGDFPFGKISYNVSTVAGGTVNVRMVFPSDLPADFKLYQIDAADNFTLIENSQYTQVDATTIDLTLSDGGSLDLDGDSSNGLIVAPVTAGTPASDPVTASSGGGAINPWSLTFLIGALLARRRHLY